jgi:hypothetical protein
MGQRDDMLRLHPFQSCTQHPHYMPICCAIGRAAVPPAAAAAAADMPDMFSGAGFNPAMLSQMDPASLAQLQKMAAQVRR